MILTPEQQQQARLKRAANLAALTREAERLGLVDIAAQLARRSLAATYRATYPKEYRDSHCYNCVACGYPVSGPGVPLFETYCECAA